MQTEPNDATKYVIDPETNQRYNGGDILKEIAKALYTKNYKSFLQNMELLRSCIIWVDTIEKQLERLFSIFNKDGFSKSLNDQIDVVLSYLDKEVKKYNYFIDSYEKLYLDQKDETGLSFLCPALDKITGGVQSGTIFTIAGGPGTMKTTYAVNLAYNAIQNGSLLFFRRSTIKINIKIVVESIS